MSAEKIAVSGIRNSFFTGSGSLPVIDGISFSVADGEFVAIVGTSGCGKSTLRDGGYSAPTKRRRLSRMGPMWLRSGSGA